MEHTGKNDDEVSAALTGRRQKRGFQGLGASFVRCIQVLEVRCTAGVPYKGIFALVRAPPAENVRTQATFWLRDTTPTAPIEAKICAEAVGLHMNINLHENQCKLLRPKSMQGKKGVRSLSIVRYNEAERCLMRLQCAGFARATVSQVWASQRCMSASLDHLLLHSPTHPHGTAAQPSYSAKACHQM
eukprot:1159128-Pelagomonas_calceolata.AAC.2